MKAHVAQLTGLSIAFIALQTLAGAHQEWANRYSLLSNKTNQAITIALSLDNSIVVGGSSVGTNGDLDYLTIKYAPDGDQVWLSRFDSPTNGNDLLRAMAVDKAGRVVLTGTSKTVKLDTNGNLLWAASYAGRGVAADSNYVYATGFSETDFNTAKLNTLNGTNIWTATYDYIGGADVSQKVAVDSSGNVYVAGSRTVETSPLPWVNFAMVKYFPNGLGIWTNSPYGDCCDSAADVRAIFVDSSSNLFVMGNHPYSHPLTTGDNHNSYFTTKSDANGNGLWTYGLDDPVGNYFAAGRGMVVDANGNTYLTGRVDGGIVCWTVKLNTNGSRIWIAQYPTTFTSRNEGKAIALDSAGNIYITGNFLSTSNSDVDIVTIKYDNNGNQLWLQRYDGPAHGDDIATGIVVDNETNVYVTGYSVTTNGGTEFVTIKYSQKPALNIEKQPNGSMRLKVFADPGQTWAFQTTTTVLTNWQTIGTATTDTNGVAQYDHTNPPPIPPRFYRGISPPP